MVKSLSENLYDLGELMADNLNTVGVSDADVDDGLTTLANKILNVSPTKINTVLSLDTPLVVYTDNFEVTGSLEDANGNSIAGATIQLIWNDGSEHIATGTTNSNGVFSFISTDPASVSSYSFQLFFAGNANYNPSNSSVVNVNTQKETSVLNITNPSSGVIVSSDTITIEGTLFDNDGTAMSGKSVFVSLNGGTGVSVSVGSDGSFSKTITGLVAGSNSISASFEAITTHTSSSQSITVNRTTFDGLADLSLIDGSQILSYADEQQTPNSQYATLETQLLNGQSAAAIAGVSVDFYDYTDANNPVLLGSDDTDSSGKASFTYHSVGVGDVPIKAKVGSFVTETYSIEDIYKYDSLTENKSQYTVKSGSASITYSSNGVNITGNASDMTETIIEYNTPLPTNYTAELTLKSVSGTTNYGGFLFENLLIDFDSDGGGRCALYQAPNYSRLTSFSTDLVNEVIKIEMQNGSLKFYINNVLKGTYTISSTGKYKHRTFRSRGLVVKDLKIKQL